MPGIRASHSVDHVAESESDMLTDEADHLLAHWSDLFRPAERQVWATLREPTEEQVSGTRFSEGRMPECLEPNKPAIRTSRSPKIRASCRLAL